jgi:hypothetical protein
VTIAGGRYDRNALPPNSHRRKGADNSGAVRGGAIKGIGARAVKGGKGILEYTLPSA